MKTQISLHYQISSFKLTKRLQHKVPENKYIYIDKQK